MGNYHYAARMQILKTLSIKYPNLQNYQLLAFQKASYYCQSLDTDDSLPVDDSALLSFVLLSLKESHTDSNFIYASMNYLQHVIDSKVFFSLEARVQTTFLMEYLGMIESLFSHQGVKKNKLLLDNCI